MNPTILVVICPGFLNQVPTLRWKGAGLGLRVQSSRFGVEGFGYRS